MAICWRIPVFFRTESWLRKKCSPILRTPNEWDRLVGHADQRSSWPYQLRNPTDGTCKIIIPKLLLSALLKKSKILLWRMGLTPLFWGQRKQDRSILSRRALPTARRFVMGFPNMFIAPILDRLFPAVAVLDLGLPTGPWLVALATNLLESSASSLASGRSRRSVSSTSAIVNKRRSHCAEARPTSALSSNP